LNEGTLDPPPLSPLLPLLPLDLQRQHDSTRAPLLSSLFSPLSNNVSRVSDRGWLSFSRFLFLFTHHHRLPPFTLKVLYRTLSLSTLNDLLTTIRECQKRKKVLKNCVH
jgi:hypothetical protein